MHLGTVGLASPVELPRHLMETTVSSQLEPWVSPISFGGGTCVIRLIVAWVQLKSLSKAEVDYLTADQRSPPL